MPRPRAMPWALGAGALNCALYTTLVVAGIAGGAREWGALVVLLAIAGTHGTMTWALRKCRPSAIGWMGAANALVIVATPNIARETKHLPGNIVFVACVVALACAHLASLLLVRTYVVAMAARRARGARSAVRAPRIVGVPCAACSRKIVSELEAAICKECEQPLHTTCGAAHAASAHAPAAPPYR